jgi:3-oxoacyl-[acyl-carrier-protein] synthase-3
VPLQILGAGHHLPEAVVPSTELEPGQGYPAGWAKKHVGILERRKAGAEELSWHMGQAASEMALDRAGVSASEVDLLLVHGSCPELYYPDAAWFLAHALGVPDAAFVLGFRGACAGFLSGLEVVRAFLESGRATTALLVCPERMFRPAQAYDRSALLFGDGAAAAVVRMGEGRGLRFLRVQQESEHAARCVLATSVLEPGERAAVGAELEETWRDRHAPEGIVGFWDGGHIFEHAVEHMGEAAMAALEETGLGMDEIDHFLFHQANAKILRSLIRYFELPRERVHSNIATVGNISAATVPFLLSEGLASGRIRSGQRVLMGAFGAGYTYGAAILEIP